MQKMCTSQFRTRNNLDLTLSPLDFDLAPVVSQGRSQSRLLLPASSCCLNGHKVSRLVKPVAQNPFLFLHVALRGLKTLVLALALQLLANNSCHCARQPHIRPTMNFCKLPPESERAATSGPLALTLKFLMMRAACSSS